MITVKQAALIARQHLEDILGTNVASVRIEETELSEDEKKWYITLSFSQEDDLFSSRTYKSFAIDSESGNLKSMKIRNINEN